MYYSLISSPLAGMTARLEKLENQLLSRKWSGDPVTKQDVTQEEKQNEEEEGTSCQHLLKGKPVIQVNWQTNVFFPKPL